MGCVAISPLAGQCPLYLTMRPLCQTPILLTPLPIWEAISEHRHVFRSFPPWKKGLVFPTSQKVALITGLVRERKGEVWEGRGPLKTEEWWHWGASLGIISWHMCHCPTELCLQAFEDTFYSNVKMAQNYFKSTVRTFNPRALCDYTGYAPMRSGLGTYE